MKREDIIDKMLTSLNLFATSAGSVGASAIIIAAAAAKMKIDLIEIIEARTKANLEDKTINDKKNEVISKCSKIEFTESKPPMADSLKISEVLKLN